MHKVIRHNIQAHPDRGGLGHCTICGAAEEELLTFCPGEKLSEESKQDCSNGNVIDLFLRTCQLQGFEFTYVHFDRVLQLAEDPE